MKNSRNLDAVIDQLCAVIPDERADVRDKLKEIALSHAFVAPEMQTRAMWLEAGDVLETLGDPEGVEWKERVRDIFCGPRET